MQKELDEQKYNILSILGFIFGFLAPLVGLILAIIALNQIKKTGERGRGLAIAAIIISIAIMILIPLILVLIWVAIKPGLTDFSELNLILSLIN